MSIRDEKKENDLIYQTLLKEEQVGVDEFAGSASGGENQVQVGKTNGEEKADKAVAARDKILGMVRQIPLDQQASVWHAILQDTNLAGRVIERWDHQLQKVLIQSLVEHGETDAFNNIIPPRPVAHDPNQMEFDFDEPKVKPHPGGGELDLGQ
tara:strand:- start:388 stop:846 length:459 start_codon:yes stop_codon:yes gene_type:complete